MARLARLMPNGSVRLLTDIGTFENLEKWFQVNGTGPSRDAVPSGLAVGPDAAYYVGQLTGGPFATSIANVYRVPPHGGEPTVVAQGFTDIVDITLALTSLYVVQIASPIPNFGGGMLIRIAPDGTRSHINCHWSLRGGVAIAKDGTIYVTTNGLSASARQVLRIVP